MPWDVMHIHSLCKWSGAGHNVTSSVLGTKFSVIIWNISMAEFRFALKLDALSLSKGQAWWTVSNDKKFRFDSANVGKRKKKIGKKMKGKIIGRSMPPKNVKRKV